MLKFVAQRTEFRLLRRAGLQPGRNETFWKRLQPLKLVLVAAPPRCGERLFPLYERARSKPQAAIPQHLYIVLRYFWIDSTFRHPLVCNCLTPFGPYASLRWGASIGFLRGRQFDYLGFFWSLANSARSSSKPGGSLASYF